MDPLSPATSTLSPAISHIAETASTFADEMAKDATAQNSASIAVKRRNQNVVQWALEGPERLQALIDQGNPGEAHDQWVILQDVLNRWGSVKGSAELRAACVKVVSPAID
jgi:vacuolar protein sorting-associated protein 51